MFLCVNDDCKWKGELPEHRRFTKDSRVNESGSIKTYCGLCKKEAAPVVETDVTIVEPAPFPGDDQEGD